MKKNYWVVGGVVVAGLALLVPVVNLVVGSPKGTAVTRTATSDPQLAQAAQVLEARCANCHTTDTKMPFYAALPVAGEIIRKDIDAGRRSMDLTVALYPKDGGAPSEVALAKIEYEVGRGQMPPGRYLALHWDGGLSASDKDTLARWIRGTRIAHYAPAGLPESVAADAVHPIPAKVEVDARKVALGEKLYHDKRLSGDDTLSCATCHDLAKGGTDQEKTSRGIRGQMGPINAPTTYNSMWQTRQFWDGRAATLQEQAGGPPLNPVEMGSTGWDQIVAKLQADEALAREFTAVYPEGFTGKTITDAIAEYEKTLATPNSKFDRYLAGDAAALDADEKHGYEVFRSEGCHTCHVGRLLGGQSFELMGRKADYFADRGNLTPVDEGRYNATKKEEDRRHFKVPTLRNVALTHPYFHDGTVEDLPAAVRAMAKYEVGRPMSEGDVQVVAKFLRTLTGQYRGQSL